MDYLRSYKNVYDQNIILLFKGELTYDLVTSMIGTLEERLDELESNRKVRKKFYSIATECIQNLYYHLEEVNTIRTKVSSFDAKSALIMISARSRFYSLQTGNYIPADRIEAIKKRLDEVNNTDPEQLRELYKQNISDQKFGKVGVGFIDIARKTGGRKLRYKFEPVTENLSFFTLQVRVPRDQPEQ